jgi:hypothetical protein
MIRIRPVLFALLLSLFSVVLSADEGMWLFNQFPQQLVATRYNFQASGAFLDHLRLASVRFNNGGSGSFISPHGLLFTNHHVGSDCIQQLSSAQHDYMAHGFYAATPAEEKTCPDLEVNVLLKIEDVTAKVKAAGASSSSAAEANRARKSAMTQIEKQCAASTGHRCDVVPLFSGGEYHLYEYKKYTDVRLVFAPEVDIAAFGGDPDNFTYPRYCLDFSLFRAYENGQPVTPADYFKWSREGVRDGELTFVPGNPGTTGRLMTVSELEFARDYRYPLTLRAVGGVIKALEAYGAASPENRRVAQENLLMQQNTYKAYTGYLAGLRDPQLMASKRREEQQLREAVQRDPRLHREYGSLWDNLAAADRDYRGFFKPHVLLDVRPAPGSDLFAIARHVLRYAEERTKPNDQRLRAYTDSALASLEQQMYSTAPIDDSLEIAVLTEYLRLLQQELGTENPIVTAVLKGKAPALAAQEYVSTSKLKDVAERRRLANNLEAVRESSDGMIRLARLLDAPARAYRKRFEDSVEAVFTTSAAKVAQARFAVRGTNDYPDATFTLRVTFGPVRGYRNAAGENVPYTTTFAGLYRRATGQDPFRLPPSWIAKRSALNLDTPFNFVTTADTHGGNSGSPTLNTKGEIVGILFDGNIESLPNRFVYTENTARSVHVASQAIIEALRQVYRADRILNELVIP